MLFQDSHDPIIACSTGTGSNTAIGVIRISGLDDFQKIEHLFSLKRGELRPRYAHFCQLIFENEVIDELILTYFPKESSFNGENVFELSVHGNQINIKRIIDIFVSQGLARHADGGEFTYRALKNKKMTLSQVEGLDLLLNASSTLSLRQGHSLMSGSLQRAYLDLHQAYLKHRGSIELSLDFSEDIGEEEGMKQIHSTLEFLMNKIKTLQNRVNNSGLNIISPEIVLLGPPNAGKSSFFNSMIDYKRSIVSDIKGTTRDYISERIMIEQCEFTLIDTAGIRSTQDEIEEIGVLKALELYSRAFYKILLINPQDYIYEDLKEIDFSQIDLLLLTHKDLEGFSEANKSFLSDIFGSIGPENNIGPMGAEGKMPARFPLVGELNLLEAGELTIYKQNIFQKYQEVMNTEPLLLERHSDLINKLYLDLIHYKSLLDDGVETPIIASELNIVSNCISELIGIVSPDEVLHSIFANFCIGK